MKKLIKRKLFFTNGCSKNYFLWEINGTRGSAYEIIEEFKGHRIARAMLKGMYNDRIKALLAFKKFVSTEDSMRHVAFGQRLETRQLG